MEQQIVEQLESLAVYCQKLLRKGANLKQGDVVLARMIADSLKLVADHAISKL